MMHHRHDMGFAPAAIPLQNDGTSTLFGADGLQGGLHIGRRIGDRENPFSGFLGGPLIVARSKGNGRAGHVFAQEFVSEFQTDHGVSLQSYFLCGSVCITRSFRLYDIEKGMFSLISEQRYRYVFE